LFLFFWNAFSFQPEIPRHPTRRSTSSSTSSSSLQAAKRFSYSDDCFGLIFLSGALVANDEYFSATFLGLSAVGALFEEQQQNMKRERQDKLLPAIVAGLTLLLQPLWNRHLISWSLVVVVASTAATEDNSMELTALGLEALVCFISMIYGVVSTMRVYDE
jgi:hypothetical protein